MVKCCSTKETLWSRFRVQ